MIRQETLTSKQHDLSRCILSRELKLRELYFATGIYQGISRGHDKDIHDAVTNWGDGESLFLEANDISQGRFLDLSTLQNKIATQEALRANVKPPPIRTAAVGSDKNGDPAGLGRCDISKKEQKDSSGPGDAAKPSVSSSIIISTAETPQAPSHNGNEGQEGGEGQPMDRDHGAAGAGSSLTRVVESAGHTETNSAAHPHLFVGSAANLIERPSKSLLNGSRDGLNPASAIRPSDALPFTSDDPSYLPKSVVTSVASHQISSNLQSTQLPPKEDQEASLGQLLPQEYSKHKVNNEVVSEPQIATKLKLEDAATRAAQSAEDRRQNTVESPVVEKDALQSPYMNNVPSLKNSDHAQLSAQPSENAPPQNSADNPSLPKVQSRTDRFAPTFTSTSATQDAQLRLEEAQSIPKPDFSSGSKASPDRSQTDHGPRASAPSELVHGGADEEGSQSSTHVSGAENGFGHHSILGRGFVQHEHDQHATKPTAALRDRAFSGMVGDSSKDLTLSRRPPMRIDTGVSSIAEPLESFPIKKTVNSSGEHPYTPSSSLTPNKSAFSTAQAYSPPDRMITRVSSGARRHKSVSEILGETPKATAHNGEKGFFDRGQHDMVRIDAPAHLLKKDPSATSPESAAFKMRLNELKGKERSKLSSVVFAGTQPPNSLNHLDSSQLPSSDVDNVHLENKECLEPLFAIQASAATFSRHLHGLISSAHKTLSTSNHYTNFHAQQDYRILERILHLQSSNCWSLRQLARSDEPDRPTSHRDVLLSHAKWMATDFREERKWKIAAAKSIANSCAEWVNGSAEERRLMEIKTRSVPANPDAIHRFAPTPDLILSAEDDSSVGTDVVTPRHEMSYGSAPSAIFAMAPEMFCFSGNKSGIAQKLLLELPLYQPSVQFKDASLKISDESPDCTWKTPIVPVSHLAEGKVVSHEEGPPRKKSRYSYEDVNIGQRHGSSEFLLQLDTCNVPMRPEQDNVALLNPDNKHIRDRIHAGHAFRPPTEHVMPSQSFFECRQPSQWTQGEDDELRKLVREYAYNWSLISSCLSSPSMFSSGAERRTPWECFERWISLEGLPAEMSKTQYFRAYHSRLQAAQKTHEAQQQALQQTQGSNTPHLPMRRRSTQPHLVDRRKNDKHLRMLEAMRKLAKKRETALHKQQHVAGLAAMRKANEAVQPRAAMHTPQEFSRVKYERECKMQESAKAFRAQMLQQQKAAHAQKAAQQSGQSGGGPPGIPPGIPSGMPPGVPPGVPPGLPSSRPPGTSGPNSNMTLSIPNGHPPPSQVNQPRPIPPPSRPVNGSQPNGLHAASGNPHTIPHAPMQTHPMQQRMQPQLTSENMRIYHEATRVQAEQQRFLMHQRQQQLPHTNGQTNSSASSNMGSLKPMAQTNPAMLASLHGRSSSPSGTAGGPPPTMSSSSPRMTTASQAQSLSSGLVPAVNEISNQIKNLHPNASPEQLKKMTTDALMKFRNNHAAQAAMHAAAGTNAAVNSNINLANLPTPPLPTQPVMMNGVSRSPPLYNPQQQYSQILRNQQSTQQSRNTASGMGAPRPGSRCGTPQMHRSGSMQAGTAPAQSPRPGPAQIAGPQ